MTAVLAMHWRWCNLDVRIASYHSARLTGMALSIGALVGNVTVGAAVTPVQTVDGMVLLGVGQLAQRICQELRPRCDGRLLHLRCSRIGALAERLLDNPPLSDYSRGFFPIDSGAAKRILNMDCKRIFLSEKDIPTAWYNLQADLPQPVPPPLHPGTQQPLAPSDLEPIFARELVAQEVSRERWIEIPEAVRQVYAIWRPSPLVRAKNLEKALKTPARIYFKDESHSPPGSHKPNTAVPQAYYNKIEGINRLSTETGAGQWGSSLAFACSFFDMHCKVYMVKVSYQQKPYRRSMMHVWGAEVTASPSEETEAGRQILAVDPDCPGTLGMAISEAVEVAVKRDDTKYTLGSVLNHVMLHQSIIGLETEKQLELAEDFPDVVLGCVGGGSNFAGLAFPLLRHKLAGRDIRFVACEPHSCPSMSRGQYRYDFGDTTKLTPLIKMFTLGHGFVPPGIHAGGLRYHGMAPMVSLCAKLGLIEAEAFHQIECFEAARLFAATEGIIPAPESSHAIRGAINEAVRCRETGEAKCILFNLSGHGLCDMASYDRFLSNKLVDYAYPQEKIEQAIAELPTID